MDLTLQWTASEGRTCAACATAVPVISEPDAVCPLCWATRTDNDPDWALGQAIAVEGLLLLDEDPARVAGCVSRLRSLSDHATRPAVTAVLADAARDLEQLAAEIR